MKNKILVGKIVGTSGLKGCVRVHSFCETPNDFLQFTHIHDKDENCYVISRIISTKGSVSIISIKDINSISEAEKIVGEDVYITREAMKEPEKGTYYYIDLIGIDVYFEGSLYGSVVDVVNYGASDIIEIKDKNTGKLVMYPFIDDFIESCDVDSRRIELKVLI